jgi:hypothetical protein
MRKDRIEQKLLELDKELKDLKSENRQNSDALVSEMRKFQERILEERASSVREMLFRGMQNLVYGKLAVGSSETFDELFINPCPYDVREQCVESFSEFIKSDATDIISREGKPVLSNTRINEQQMNIFKRKPCDRCLKIYSMERQKLLDFSDKLAENITQLSSKKREPYFDDMPDEIVVRNILEPLSHVIRFKIIKSLMAGGRSFKELREVTGSEGGHLIYHIDKLIETGFVIKDEAVNQYLITDKGIGLMNSIKKLYIDNIN